MVYIKFRRTNRLTSFNTVWISGLLSLTSIEGLLFRPLKNVVVKDEDKIEENELLGSQSNAKLSITSQNYHKSSSSIHEEDTFYNGNFLYTKNGVQLSDIIIRWQLCFTNFKNFTISILDSNIGSIDYLEQYVLPNKEEDSKVYVVVNIFNVFICSVSIICLMKWSTYPNNMFH